MIFRRKKNSVKSWFKNLNHEQQGKVIELAFLAHLASISSRGTVSKKKAVQYITNIYLKSILPRDVRQ